MDRIKIRGGKALEGKIYISGSKNSVVSLIPAAILSDSATIEKIPNISDVIKVFDFLKGDTDLKDEFEQAALVKSEEMINISDVIKLFENKLNLLHL